MPAPQQTCSLGAGILVITVSNEFAQNCELDDSACGTQA